MSAFDDAKYRYGKEIREIKEDTGLMLWTMLGGTFVLVCLLLVAISLINDLSQELHEISHYLELEHDDHAVGIEEFVRAHRGG